MDKSFKVEIYTPFGKYLSTEATYLSTTTPVGVLGVLPNHAPLISTLEISKLIIKNNNTQTIYALSGGVIHIKKDHSVVLLVNTIENQEEIDVARAVASKNRAMDRLNNRSVEVDVARAKLSLLRATNRISVSENK